MRLRLKQKPIGTTARRYSLPVMFTVFVLMSDVDEASHCVARVAKKRCHVVRSIAGLD